MGCDLCNSFRGKREPSSKSQPINEPGIRHHIVPSFQWDELVLSAESCYCCGILVQGCRECFHHRGLAESDIVRGCLRFYYPMWSDGEEDDDWSADKVLCFALRDGFKFDVEFFMDEESPCPDAWDYMFVSERTATNTGSPEALKTIQSWITSCTNQHDDIMGPGEECWCEEPNESPLPTRLVHVGETNDNIKIHETHAGERKCYLCLSHCWGTRPILTTTIKNLEQHKTNIPWQSLSKTFQEAIWLTRELGFEYIWIDSLCIIQDSPRDWEFESAQMASIYSRGYLTIAAVHSAGGDGGLFSATKDFKVIGTTPDDADEYCVYFRERIDHHSEAIESNKKRIETLVEGQSTEVSHPLLTRAWVYQERMLSPRVIHFGHYEVSFECRTHEVCECGGIGFHDAGLGAPETFMKREYAEALDDYEHLGRENFADKLQYQSARLWRTMVAAYTSLRLTKAKDRLPAIGGLARDLAARRKTRYLAGVWEDTMSDDLLWKVVTPRKKPRAQPRTAPTWSWASVQNHVLYYDGIFFSFQGGNYDFMERQPYKHLSSIEDCDVSPSAVDEFGAIANGSIKISGLLAFGRLEYKAAQKPDPNGESEKLWTQYYVSFPGGLCKELTADYALDDGSAGTDGIASGTEVCCLRMSQIQEGSTDFLASLVLKKLPQEDTFERIGVLESRAKPPPVDTIGEVFKDAQLGTVTIV